MGKDVLRRSLFGGIIIFAILLLIYLSGFGAFGFYVLKLATKTGENISLRTTPLEKFNGQNVSPDLFKTQGPLICFCSKKAFYNDA